MDPHYPPGNGTYPGPPVASRPSGPPLPGPSLDPDDAWHRAPWWQKPFRFVGAVLGRVFVEPVAQGRFRIIAWPRGLALIAVLVTAAYAVAATLAVLAPWLRDRLGLVVVSGDQGVGVPAGLSWVVIALMLLAASVFQTGALHTPWWFRIPAWLASTSILVTACGSPYALWQVGLLAGASLALLGFQVIRRRASFRWWEYVVVVICFAVPVAAAYRSLQRVSTFAANGAAEWLSLALPQVELMAAPVAVMAGYAIAQWAFSTVVWTVDLGRRRLPRWVLTLVLVGLLLWRLGAEWWTVLFGTWDLAEILWPIGLLAGGGVLWVVLDKIADRHGPGTTRIADLSTDLRSVAVPLAVVMTISGLFSGVVTLPAGVIGFLLPVDVLTPAFDLIDTFLDSDIEGALVAALLLVWAFRMAWRADRGRAELLALMALLSLAMKLASAKYTTDLIGVYVVTGLFLVFVVLLFGRRLDRIRMEGMLVAVGLATIWSTRSLFDDPINALLGGSAALILSLVWTFLTGGEDANGDTHAFPRASRVCLLMANALFGMVVLMYHRMTLGMTSVMEVQQLVGDRILGGSLILGALAAALTAVFRREDLAGMASDTRRVVSNR